MTKSPSSGRKTATLLLTLLLTSAGALVPSAASASEHPRHGLIRGEVARPAPPPAAPLPVRDGPVGGAVPRAAQVLATDQVALRPLVIALDSADFGLPTWKAVLNRAGSPYDVLYAKSDPLTAAKLVRGDGAGKYNAILLTDNALLYQDGSGNYISGLDPAEWNTLWDYERTFKVRQVSLYTSWGSFPEDYCLRPGIEGSVGASIQSALTTDGVKFFSDLNPSSQIPISYSYVYRSKLAAGCNAQPLLTSGGYVLGVTSPSADGRERAALTFSSNEYLMQTDLLGYGLLRWATRGVLTGEFRHWLTADVDDWFNYNDHRYPDGHVETDPGFRLTGPEAAAANGQQIALRSLYPLAANFTLNLPYNGDGIVAGALPLCTSLLSPDPLTSFSKCLANNFRWINHTLTHPDLNTTTYAVNKAEIADNLTVGRQNGFTVPTEVLKTPAYSGLGVYNPDPNAPDTDPPTDFGLAASNRNMLTAAKDLGVKYLHGNMSFASHRPSCFNCGINHPLEPSLMIVPDWPTNIGYQATTADEETSLYNSLYGPNGRFPYYDHDLNYTEVIGYESDVTLQHVMSGSAYTHTLHEGNLHQYNSSQSLTFDLLRATVQKYSSHYQVPLKNPDWPALAAYVKARTAHFAEFAAGQDPVWNKTTNTVSYTPTKTGSVFLTGVTGASASSERYGAENIAQFNTVAGTRFTATATPRP
ncbi:hypothetical protein SAMN05421504_1011337 [Amycolatopsis xylanica]|uniref:Agd3 CBM87 domain-containing protein n=1 Tax=Amycolatopsis xylanica TaxID=589385 RepID=A0A1H2VV56_9PSEU|nr:hypothetical protein [Amycolatopsis xylanica]SDW72137.1 hypothetical protein SAMN05421504_1011337 [Amycolatopsis xylanica]